MPISFSPLRNYLAENKISYYFLSNQGIDAQTLQRLRHDRPVSTVTLGRLCEILGCQPADLICYSTVALPEENEEREDVK